MRSIRMTCMLGNASYKLRRCPEQAANKESTIESISRAHTEGLPADPLGSHKENDGFLAALWEILSNRARQTRHQGMSEPMKEKRAKTLWPNHKEYQAEFKKGWGKAIKESKRDARARQAHAKQSEQRPKQDQTRH